MHYPSPIMPFWSCAFVVLLCKILTHWSLTAHKTDVVQMQNGSNDSMNESTRGHQLSKLCSLSFFFILSFLVFIIHSFPGFISPSCSSQLQFLDRAPIWLLSGRGERSWLFEKNSSGKANYTQTKHFACYCVRDSCLID